MNRRKSMTNTTYAAVIALPVIVHKLSGHLQMILIEKQNALILIIDAF